MTESHPSPAMPAETGLPQLLWLIHHAAEGQEPVEEFIRQFRARHEAIESAGRPRYRSKEEARLIWDVLWALEFYSPDPARETEPADWNSPEAVLAEIQRVSRRLKAL